MLFVILNAILVLVAIYVIIMGSRYNKASGDNSAKDTVLHPAEANYLYKDMTYLNRGILVTLLELMRRGKISIEEYVRDSRNLTLADYVIEYRFTLLDTTDLKDHEKVFLGNIFVDTTVITTDELTQRAISGKEFLSVQGNWSNVIDQELAYLNLYEESNKGLSNKIKLLGVFTLSVGIITLIRQDIWGLMGLLASMPILLVGINIGMDKSTKGRALLSHFGSLEEQAKSGKIKHKLSEKELLELLALTLTMKYFLPIYENSDKYETINLVTNTINEYGGSAFDDAILRGFMGFTAKTRDDTLDTNRIDYRLFK